MSSIHIEDKTLVQRFFSFLGEQIFLLFVIIILIVFLFIIIYTITFTVEEILSLIIYVIWMILFIYMTVLRRIKTYITYFLIEEKVLMVMYRFYNMKKTIMFDIKDINVELCIKTFRTAPYMTIWKKMSKYDSKKILTQYCYLDWAKEENINALKKMIEDAQSHKE